MRDFALVCSKHEISRGYVGEEDCVACSLIRAREVIVLLRRTVEAHRESERLRKTTQDVEQMGVNYGGG
jgi:hypothetical protein